MVVRSRLENEMATNRPLKVNPPYTSAGELNRCFDLFSRQRPEVIDSRWLHINGFTEANAPALLSGLRALKIIDEEGNVIDPTLLIRLGNPQDRPDAIRDIVENAYADILNQTDIEKATVKSIDLYFQYHHVKPSTSSKAARLFMWLAQGAGYKLGEQISLTSLRPKSSWSCRC